MLHEQWADLSQEQLRFWDEQGYLTLRQALPPATAAALSAMADEAAALPRGACYPWLLHDERSRVDGEVRICRVENFVKHHRGWGEVGLGLLQQLVTQAFRAPAVLFKDKINFKGPGGGGFLAHQDATAYATDKLATRHISVRLPIDDSTAHNGPLEVAPGQHRRGILPHDGHHRVGAGGGDALRAAARLSRRRRALRLVPAAPLVGEP